LGGSPPKPHLFFEKKKQKTFNFLNFKVCPLFKVAGGLGDRVPQGLTEVADVTLFDKQILWDVVCVVFDYDAVVYIDTADADEYI